MLPSRILFKSKLFSNAKALFVYEGTLQRNNLVSSSLLCFHNQRRPDNWPSGLHINIPVINLHSCCKAFSIQTMNRQEVIAKALWRSADAVCFDVDSTVCMDEAIDELAKFAGKEKEVAELTQSAMRGGMTFREALALRLDLIQPTVDMMKDYLRKHKPRLTPGIKELISTLHSREIPVYLVSGGFDTIIEPVADILDIPFENIFANKLKYFFSGDYAGFDENQPTCEQDGKAQVAAYLKHRFGYQRLVMVGDGVTDLVASPPADLFIGFGGNQVREKVRNGAKWFVKSFDELNEELQNN